MLNLIIPNMFRNIFNNSLLERKKMGKYFFIFLENLMISAESTIIFIHFTKETEKNNSVQFIILMKNTRIVRLHSVKKFTDLNIFISNCNCDCLTIV